MANPLNVLVGGPKVTEPRTGEGTGSYLVEHNAEDEDTEIQTDAADPGPWSRGVT